ncbi:MAG: GNAT family N-acetyltransferase [Planctomycetota bacterium]
MIRRLGPADADAFFGLRLLGLELHPEAFATSADAWREATPDHVEAVLTAAGPSADDFVLGALLEGELVGLIGFRRERRQSLRHKGSIWGYFVHPDHRRQGLGARLLSAAIQEVSGVADLVYVRLVATSSAEEAMRMFRKHGFVPYGREGGGLRLGASSFDQEFLRRDLGG